MKPVINEYVRELSHPGYNAAQRNAFVAAMVSKRLMRRTEQQPAADEAAPALASSLNNSAGAADARAGNDPT
ncbi:MULTISPECIES: hypothetical protein [Achromobacter]|jgi:hypothetical protein|uniref:hypothetical protein n=1 Tax=Achromobacter TaxID=222 RepID=UPI00146764FC|nr:MULTISPECIES: hypothetical protein [Achromobacter]MBD9472450.1 hypothetical protein [Achromobacter sp. ACM01]CAB3629823.1 hypothetical protein LMG26852_00991 [Achromobacter aegrifaciens]